MTFANQRNVLIHDQYGNLYNFRWVEDKIIFTHFDKYLNKYYTDTLVEDCTLEFDVAIDEENQVYFVYQRNDGNMILMSLLNGIWTSNSLGGDHTLNVFNLNMLIYHQKIHMFYCVSSNESDRTYRIYHHYYDKQEWKTFEVQDIRRKNLLNPFQIIKNKEKLIIGFYELVNDEEQIFIKEFDIEKSQWKNAIQLTTDSNDKLYLDILMTNDGFLHLTYSKYLQGNLVIKYEKYELHNDPIVKKIESILSNPSNCSYPAFVMHNEKLWNVWTEYDQILSSFTTDGGITWSDPYMWKESKDKNFFRYKFDTNDKYIHADYKLNHAFGKDCPEFSFIGFGPLEKAVKTPLKEIKKKEEWDIVEFDEVRKIESQTNNNEFYKREINKLQKDIESLEEKIKNMDAIEQRIESIEEYLNRRRRGLFSSRK